MSWLLVGPTRHWRLMSKSSGETWLYWVSKWIDWADRPALVGIGFSLRCFPVVDGEFPLAVLALDVGLVDDSFGKCVVQLD